MRSRPVFQLRYTSPVEVEERALRQARFKIELSLDGFESSAYVFDQRRRARGWFWGDDGFVVFRPGVPLADGAYEWRVRHWNGTTWVGSGAVFRLTIDSVPPANIEGLELGLDRDSGALRLAWEPVTLDRSGGAEFVRAYRVYRYEDGPPFPAIPAHEVGRSEVPGFVERPGEGGLPRPLAPGLWLYRVVAEDEAGNLSTD